MFERSVEALDLMFLLFNPFLLFTAATISKTSRKELTDILKHVVSSGWGYSSLTCFCSQFNSLALFLIYRLNLAFEFYSSFKVYLKYFVRTCTLYGSQ